jgi:hypothetical protein
MVLAKFEFHAFSFSEYLIVFDEQYAQLCWQRNMSDEHSLVFASFLYPFASTASPSQSSLLTVCANSLTNFTVSTLTVIT